MNMKKMILTSAIVLGMSSIAYAEKIGKIVLQSGLLSNDTATIQAVDDPDYTGVTCYVTSVDRGFSWYNASDSSIACRLIGDSPKNKPTNKNNIFVNNKTGFFKYQKIDRVYDPKRNVLVYISYVKKFSGTNYAHSISVVPLGKPLKYYEISY